MFSADNCPNQEVIREVPGTHNWVSYDPIYEGDSSDEKYKIKDANGQSYLLCLAEKTQYDRKKNEFAFMERLHRNQIPVPRPIQHGVSKTGESTFILRDWIAGQTGRCCLSQMDPVRQYALGHEAGLYIAVLHNFQSRHSADMWSKTIDREHSQAIEQMGEHDVQLVCVQKLICYLRHNRKVLLKRPQTVIHGEINLDNMILTQDGSLYLIDFEKWCYGDPLYDIASVITDISLVSHWFATGFLDCYFRYQMRTKTCRIIACYVALQALRRFSTDRNKSQKARQTALRHVQQIVRNYRNMTQVIPVWYQELPEMKSDTRIPDSF